MAFQLIKVEHLRIKQITRKPIISFSKSGSITVNSIAMVWMDIQEGEYIKLLRDGDKLAVFKSEDAQDAIKLRINRKNPKEPIGIGQFLNLVNMLATELDWPLGDEKKSNIKYEISGDFEDPSFPGVKIFRLV